MRFIVTDSGHRLEHPTDFGSFDVASALTGDVLATVVATAGIGSVDPDGEHVWVDPAAVRRDGNPTHDSGWARDFAAMLEYADAHGWLDADGHIRAHLISIDPA